MEIEWGLWLSKGSNYFVEHHFHRNMHFEFQATNLRRFII